MDKDKSGFLHASELKQALEASDIQISQDEIDKIVAEIDYHENGKINYSEFLAATLSINKFMSNEKMWMIFKRFDVDDTDFISKENLIEAMAKMDRQITPEEVDNLLKQHDLAKDGHISFEEFKAMFYP